MRAQIINAMTVDVEDYFHVSAFEQHIAREDWGEYPTRVERNIDTVLELLNKSGTKATFFMLGWVAERFPHLARSVVADGHELASHGFSHVRVTQQSPAEFKEDISRTKRLLEDVAGVEVKGFRAASFSIGADNLWALETLAESGYKYSSSIYPVRHDLYGMPEASRFAFQVHDKLLEIPITTVRVFSRNWPCGGGGYFRLYPYVLFRAGLRHVNETERQPAVFYFHPWEVDPDQPRQNGVGLKTRFRHISTCIVRPAAWSVCWTTSCGTEWTEFILTQQLAESVHAPQGESEAENSAIEVKALGPSGSERWDEFVVGSKEGTFFHLSGWKRVIETAFGHRCHFLYAERAGRICGVCPLGHIHSRLFGSALISTPFSVYGGIISECDEAEQALRSAACALARELCVGHLELRHRVQHGSPWPGKDLYVTFRKNITPDVDENMAAIPRKQRAMVRKGIKFGLVGEHDPGVDRFFIAYSESVRNLGTPVFPVKYFRVLKEVFGDSCRVLTITKDERIVSSVLSFYFRDEVLPYYGGGTREARALKANDFMYWELMRNSCTEGLGVFDFGRSKKGTGSYSFKKNWGFEPEPLHYEYFLVRASDVPDINPLNPKYRLFVNLWRHIPLSVSRFVGPMIARNLG